MLVLDRPGYGGSMRKTGPRVADAAEGARALADAFGWERFAVHGHSGGSPGSHDTRMPCAHSDWLTAHIPTAQRFDYEGWHVPDDDVFGEIFHWLRG